MEAAEILEVRCAECGETLEVEQGLTEFACPGCDTPQALPPELMPPPPPPRPRRALPLHDRGRGGAGPGARMPCGRCGAVLSVPSGLRHLTCPLCATNLAVDGDRFRLHHVAPSGGVQVALKAGVASLGPTFVRPQEEEPIGQAIHVSQVQAERYNKPLNFAQTRGVFPARSVHRNESTNSARTNTKTAVYVGCAKDAPVHQSFHGEESRMKQARLSTTPESSCTGKVRVEYPSKVSRAPHSQPPSNYSVHTDEVRGHQSNTIGRNQQARHASISSIVEQETMMPPSQTASAEQVRAKSHCNRKRTGGRRKRKYWAFSSSNEELFHTGSKHLATQPEGTRNFNTIQGQVPSPHENHCDPADIDRIIANLHPSSSSQKHMPQAESNELDNIDGTLSPVSINHGTSEVNRSYILTRQPFTVVTACCEPNTWQPLLTGTHLPSTTSPSVLTRPSVGSVHRLPPNCQPPDTMHSQDEQDADIGNMEPKKRKPRGPNKLTEPRREADKPVLTPNNVDTWDVHPPCPKVASTISALLKQYHPGSTYIPASQRKDEVHQGELVLHFQQYHSDTRTIIMDEFLRRYKWAPGREAECLKLFNRKIVRQFTALLCDEKRKARLELAASRKVKGSLDANMSNRETNLDDQGARKKLKHAPRDPAGVGHDDDDPLQWKPFPPEWMLPKWWEVLCEHWASEEMLQVSAQKRKNRYTGGSARHTAGSRSIAMHRKLMIIENGGKPVSEVEVFNKTHKRDGGKGEFITEKARRTVEAFQRRLEAAGDTELDPHLVWAEEIGGRNKGRYYGLHGIIDKAQIGTLSKSIQGSLGRRKHRQMFTQDQVQEMINQATQQLNETWENRFQYLEESVRSMSSPDVPQHAPWFSAAGPGTEDDQAPRQSASDSASEGTYQSARDDGRAHISD